jgi:hypothetical protein
VLVLAACGDKPGAYIEIHGSKSLAAVSVYIGNDACTNNSGAPCKIAPPMLSRLDADMPGGTWFRDTTTPFTAGASGGVARVHIEASGPNEVVQLVVLGLDSTGTPLQAAQVHDVPVPSGGTQNLNVTLDDAMPVTSTEEGQQPHADGTYALTWTSTNAPTDCLVFERWDSGTVQRTFIVPENDADCDGYLKGDPLECDPYYYDFSSKNATTSRPSCALPIPVPAPSGLHTCTLGAQGCTDGVGPNGTCAQLPAPETCLSDAICASTCAQPDSTDSFYGCATTSISANGGTVMRCNFYEVTDAGTPCPTGGSILDPTSGEVSADTLFTGTTHTCKDISFAASDQLYGNQFMGMKLLAPAPSTAEIDLADRSTGVTTCTFTATWTQGLLNYMSMPQHAIADIRVDDDRHMFVPVEMSYVACTQAGTGTALGFECYVVANSTLDHITQCAM